MGDEVMTRTLTQDDLHRIGPSEREGSVVSPALTIGHVQALWGRDTAFRQSIAKRPRPVPKLGPFEIDHKSAA